MHFQYNIVGGDFTHAGSAASEIKKVLKQLNVDAEVIKRTVVAIYEAEVNIVAHAYLGTVDIEIDEHQVSALFKDSGPGIADIEKAMQEGYSTASQIVREMGFGAGMGLSNIKKNSDHLQISSTLGQGTQLLLINQFTKQA